MYYHVPTYILRRLHGEPVDFIVESEHDYGKRAIGWGIIIFSMFFSWIFLFPIFFSFPLVELFLTGHTSITVNGTAQNYNSENPWGAIWFMLIPSLISIIFIIPVAIAIVMGIMYVRKKGGWYAGTDKYLIEFNGTHVYYYRWDDFENTIETKEYKDKTFDIILTHKNLTKDSVQKHGKLTEHPHGYLNIEINGKEVNLNQLMGYRGFFRNKIGLLKIHNGQYVLNMIRHNMERFESKHHV